MSIINSNPEFDSIYEEALKLDVRKTIIRLRRELSLRVDRKNPEEFLKACDNAASNHSEINILLLRATANYHDVKKEFDEQYSKWSEEAIGLLEKEKKEGRLSGQISESRIKNKVISEFKDKYLNLKNELRKKERTVKYLEKELYSWHNRVELLRTIKGILDKQGVFGEG